VEREIRARPEGSDALTGGRPIVHPSTHQPLRFLEATVPSPLLLSGFLAVLTAAGAVDRAHTGLHILERSGTARTIATFP
jgi:hypothetical protein